MYYDLNVLLPSVSGTGNNNNNTTTTLNTNNGLDASKQSFMHKEVEALVTQARLLGYDRIALAATVDGNLLSQHANTRPPTPSFSSSSFSSSFSSSSFSSSTSSSSSTAAAESPPQLQPPLARLTVRLQEMQQLMCAAAVYNSYDCVALEPLNGDMFGKACEAIPNFDIIVIPTTGRLPYKIKPPQVNAALKRGLFFEVNIGPALLDPAAGKYLIANGRQIIRATRGRNILLSSSACSPFHMRSVYEIMNLGLLIGLTAAQCKQAVSEAPRSVLQHALTRKLHKGLLVNHHQSRTTTKRKNQSRQEIELEEEKEEEEDRPEKEEEEGNEDGEKDEEVKKTTEATMMGKASNNTNTTAAAIAVVLDEKKQSKKKRKELRRSGEGGDIKKAPPLQKKMKKSN